MRFQDLRAVGLRVQGFRVLGVKGLKVWALHPRGAGEGFKRLESPFSGEVWITAFGCVKGSKSWGPHTVACQFRAGTLGCSRFFFLGGGGGGGWAAQHSGLQG